MITSLKKWKCFILESLINEAAYSIDTVIDNEIVLSKNQSPKEIELVLYDVKSKSVIGYIKADKVDNSTFEIARSAAEKGYGPLMYDLLMMSINPMSLKPSNTIKEAALILYKYYVNKRNDVKKEVIDKNDLIYSHAYRNDQDEDYIKTHEEDLSLINQRFSLTPTQSYYNLVQLSDALIKEHKLTKRNLSKMGLDYFWDKYELPLTI